MGASASVQTQAYEATLVPLFVEEHERISKMGLSGAELVAEYQRVLASRAPELQAHVGLESSTSGKHLDVSRRTPMKETAEIAHDTLSHILQRRSLTYLVAVDGSAHSDRAFETVMRLKSRRDNTIIYHGYSLAEQRTLPTQHTRDHIQQHYEQLALTHGMSSIDVEKVMLLRERGEDEYAKDSIAALIGEYEEERRGMPFGESYYLPTKSLDIVVIGFSGSKHTESAGSTTVMGSATDLTLRSINLPVIVVKKPLPTEPKAPLTYVVAVDHSERSRKGLALVMSLVKPRDTLICLHVLMAEAGFQGDQGEEARRELELFLNAELEMFGPRNSSVVVIPQAEGHSRADIVAHFVNETVEPKPDFLCLSPRHRVTEAEELGSVSRGIVKAATCNIIFCKSR